MAIVTGDRYLEYLVKFVEEQAGPLLEGTIVLKLNPVGLQYVQSRLEAFVELESLIAGAPVDYLRAYISDLGDHRALEQLRRILRLLTSLKVVSVLSPQARDPTPLSLLPFGRLKVLELRGCDLSTSAARGLLELRHTLERIICHNSTDALRHVFASRIAEIKDSPNWNRLQFASCSCNRLVLMDESLQLLPAVETLDLSRNRFTKVDNLRKCTKLKHLDLGFNHLRTIASISEVTSHIVRLVLRNNALTTLHGIENLKSIEELDLSYNVISHFSEIEILASLPLQSLWLEGNPICCARWYRAQVFSFFAYPDKLKLDEKVISTREFWKRQIIIASRQKRPASFGFYSPAKDDADGEGSGNPKRKNLSRLACIESEEQSMSSDQDSVSCENGVRSRDEDILSNDGAEVVDLMNRIELMKKERSVLWLREFKDWMDQASGNSGENGSYSGLIPNPGGRNYLKNNKMQMHHGEGLRYVSDSIQASGDDSSTNVLESDNSFADVSTNPHTPKYFDQIVQVGSKYAAYVSGDDGASGMRRMASVRSQSSHRKVTDVSGTSLVAIDDIMESGLSSACPASPPHYQEDILHRRHNLVEEILQLSAESYSAASSDSNTSCSEDDICEFGPIIPDVDRSLFDESSHRVVGQNLSGALAEDKYIHPWHEASYITKNVSSLLYSCADQASSTLEHVKPDQSLQLCRDRLFAGCQDCEIANFVNQGTEMSDKRRKKKPKKRVVSELDENNTTERAEKSEKRRGDLGAFIDLGDQLKKRSTDGNDIREFRDNKQTFIDAVMSSLDSHGVLYGSKHSFQVTDEFVQKYFNSHIADCQVSETCRKYLRCHCMIEQQSRCGEVAVILSNENVMYLLHVDVTFDGSGTILRLIGRHRAEDVREVLVGLGLQIVRVSIEKDVSYLFVTRSIENSRRLLDVLQASDSSALNYKCPLRSLELVQIELFEELICGGLKISIFQYSMVLFWCNNDEEEIWLSRSLFVIGGHLLVCIEDLIQFSSLSVAASATPYFSLDSCCSIAHISEMVIDTRGCQCVTLVLESATSEFSRPGKEAHRAEEVAAFNKRETASRSLTWKLQWFSEENLLKFAALVKAMHAGITVSPLLVRSIP